MRAALGLLIVLPLVQGCGPSNGESQGKAVWSGVPNAYATHFEFQVRGEERRVLVFGPEGPIDNTLRFPDECVRHKTLDLIGDLALCGCDIVGQIVAYRSGHRLNADLVRALLTEGRRSVSWRRTG